MSEQAQPHRAMTCGEEAYKEMISELPPELLYEEEYKEAMAAEDEADYIEFLGLVLACQHCTKQGFFGNNCICCPERPFGKTPCRPDLHCWNECGGFLGEGGYCELVLACSYIVEVEDPLAMIAEQLFGDHL